MDDAVRSMLVALGDGATVEMSERAVAHLLPSERVAPRVELGGKPEIADALGVSRESVQIWIADPDMETPEPLAALACGRVWDLADWRGWYKVRTG